MNKSCGCDYGACFCGPSNDADLAICYDPLINEIYLFDKTGTSYHIEYFLKSRGHVFLGMLI